GNPQSLPIGCFDSAHKLLGPESYVFGYTRVYVYEPATGISNANPVIEALDTPSVGGGLSLTGDPTNQVATPLPATRCRTDDKTCPPVKIGPVVPATSQESTGAGRFEEIWVDYYSTFGSFSHSGRLLYDPATPGRLAASQFDSDTEFQPPIWSPGDPVDGFLWIVVHDNRGGASWVTVPVQLK
ncbi:MAG TPA: hypothetical protein VGY54_01660, partial [Polyangiaceae bacterium]|nr:hypothetical protein [Polyangiaceae bacterium]